MSLLQLQLRQQAWLSLSHVSDSEDEYFATPIKTEGSNDNNHCFSHNYVQVMVDSSLVLTPPGHNQHPRGYVFKSACACMVVMSFTGDI